MPEFRIVLTARAKRDMLEIHTYIADNLQEQGVADKLLDRIEAEILKLKNMPLRHNINSEEQLDHRNLRKMSVDNYLIFYTVYEKSRTVFVVRVLYARRDWMNLL